MTPLPQTIAAAALFAAFTTLASAQTVWDNEAATGLWGTATNWVGNTVPATGTSVLFNDTTTPGSVGLGNTTREVSTLEFGNTTGSYDITGGGASGQLRANTLLNSSSLGVGNVISSRVHSRGTSTANTLAFTGTGAATLTLSGAIQDQSGSRATRLNKTSSGVLIFSGTAANTFTGTTTISAGRLELAKDAGLDAISGSTLAINGGEVRLINANQVADTVAVTMNIGTFNANGFSETLGTLALTGNSFLNLGGSGTNSVSFANSSALDWTSFNLSISGSFVSGASVRFGNDATGLDAGQFDNISIVGFTGVGIDSAGWLTATIIPESFSFAAFAGLGALGLVSTRRGRRG